MTLCCIRLRPAIALTIALLVSLAPVLSSRANGPHTPADPGQWIVDYGLSYGELVESARPIDAEYVLIWMQAATIASPELAAAHLWRFDLLDRLDRADDAREALAAYRRSAPEDIHAAFKLLDIDIENTQTAEQRAALLRERLEGANLAPEFASELHRRLAAIHLAQGDTALARERIAAALRFAPLNLPALQLQAALEDRLDDPKTATKLLLTELSINPASIDARWRMADMLASWGLSERALTWYQHTQQAIAWAFPNSPAPVDLQLVIANTRAEGGDADAAIATYRSLVDVQPNDITVRMLLVRAASETERETTIQSVRDELARVVRDLETNGVVESDAVVAHALADYYLRVDYHADRALDFAKQANALAPNHPRVHGVLGEALLANNEVESALELLTPIASTDQRAALAAARALRSVDRDEEAIALLQSAARIRFAGNTYRKIRSVLRELHADCPEAPRDSAIASVFSEFDQRVLDFPKDPAAAIAFDVTLAHKAYPIAAPIIATVTLTNRAPYPLTLGEDRMVPPQVAVSLFDREMSDQRRLGYLTIDLNERLVLDPGASMSVESRVDTVTVRELIRGEAQRKVPLAFTFTLAPDVNTSGEIVTRLAGIEKVTCRATRLPVDASPAGIEQIAAQLREGQPAERLAAIDIIAALMQEPQSVKTDKPIRYFGHPVVIEDMVSLLRGALADASPIVRAKAAHTLLDRNLDDATVQSAAPLISDPHPLPRLLACELFARRQGEPFLPVLNRLANDKNPTVAALATIYRDQYATP